MGFYVAYLLNAIFLLKKKKKEKKEEKVLAEFLICHLAWKIPNPEFTKLFFSLLRKISLLVPCIPSWQRLK